MLKKITLLSIICSTLTSCSFLTIPNPFATPEIYVLKGEIASGAHYSSSAIVDSSCMGNEYLNPDVQLGSLIQVKNESNVLISTGKVLTGHIENRGTYLNEDGKISPNFRCVFDFVLKLPKANFYKINIEGHREKLYSYDELTQNNWKIKLSIESQYVP
jgi:hypothetical protein